MGQLTVSAKLHWLQAKILAEELDALKEEHHQLRCQNEQLKQKLKNTTQCITEVILGNIEEPARKEKTPKKPVFDVFYNNFELHAFGKYLLNIEKNNETKLAIYKTEMLN